MVYSSMSNPVSNGSLVVGSGGQLTAGSDGAIMSQYYGQSAVSAGSMVVQKDGSLSQSEVVQLNANGAAPSAGSNGVSMGSIGWRHKAMDFLHKHVPFVANNLENVITYGLIGAVLIAAAGWGLGQVFHGNKSHLG